MRNKRMKYLFITGLFVSMFSFGAIDASAAGFSNISESAGLIVRTEDATESGSGDGGSGDGSSSNAAQNHQDLPTYTDKTGSSKEGSPDQEVGGTPASTPASTPETTPEPTSEPSTNIVTPAAKPAAKPAKTEKKVEVKAENRIDSITIKNTDAGKSVARIYFHLDDDYSNVSFFMKASGKNEELAATSDFAETGYKIQDGEEQDGINYYFVIDTKSSLSDYYSSISQQIKDLQSNLNANDSISVYSLTGEGINKLTDSAISADSKNQEKLSEVLDGIEINSESTNIYKGLYDICSQIGPNENSSLEARNVVVAVSDGISEKTSVENENEDIASNPLYYALRENGMSLLFVKLPESTEVTDSTADYISEEIDTKEPIVYSDSCIAEVDATLRNCYVTEVEYDNPEAPWPLFYVSFGGDDSDDAVADSISKYRFFPSYLVEEKEEAEETEVIETTEEVSTESNVASENNASTGDTEKSPATVESEQEQSDSSSIFKDNWKIFAGGALAVIVLIVVIALVVKKK